MLRMNVLSEAMRLAISSLKNSPTRRTSWLLRIHSHTGENMAIQGQVTAPGRNFVFSQNKGAQIGGLSYAEITRIADGHGMHMPNQFQY